MSDDPTKRAILSRRAKFMAAALATAGLGVACGSSEPCLSIIAPPDDASTDGAKDGTTDAPTDAPQVCLSALPDAGPDGDASGDARPDAPTDSGTG